MTERDVETKRDWARLFAVIGGSYGLTAGAYLLLFLSSFGGDSALLGLEMARWAITFLSPFVFGLVGLLMTPGPRRSGMWLGAGIAVLLLSLLWGGELLLAFLGPGALLLVMAALSSRKDWTRSRLALGVSGLPLVAACIGFWGFLSMNESSCWERREEGWVRVSDDASVRVGGSLGYEGVCGEFPTWASVAVAGGAWAVAGGLPFVRREAAA